MISFPVIKSANNATSCKILHSATNYKSYKNSRLHGIPQLKNGLNHSTITRKLFTHYIIFMTILCLTSSLFCKEQNTSKLEKKTFNIINSEGKIIKVEAELATTSAQQAKGFMGRKKIPNGTGMLFVYEKDQILHFFMKNTPTALSIAYIDSSGKIRNIFDMTPFSLNTISSTCSVRYALEVPQGWFTSEKIKVGDKIDLTPLRK